MRYYYTPLIRTWDRSSRAYPLTPRWAWSLGFAALIALTSQFSLTLPFTDVPVTLQVFFVLLAGGLMGGTWGAASVGEYLIAGAMGAPVFAQGRAGPAVLFGPTGGYLFGFVLAAALAGNAFDRTQNRWLGLLSMIGGALVILLCGGFWRHFALGNPWPAVFNLAIFPFLAADLLKALAAWSLICRLRR